MLRGLTRCTGHDACAPGHARWAAGVRNAYRNDRYPRSRGGRRHHRCRRRKSSALTRGCRLRTPASYSLHVCPQFNRLTGSAGSFYAQDPKHGLSVERARAGYRTSFSASRQRPRQRSAPFNCGHIRFSRLERTILPMLSRIPRVYMRALQTGTVYHRTTSGRRPGFGFARTQASQTPPLRALAARAMRHRMPPQFNRLN